MLYLGPIGIKPSSANRYCPTYPPKTTGLTLAGVAFEGCAEVLVHVPSLMTNCVARPVSSQTNAAAGLVSQSWLEKTVRDWAYPSVLSVGIAYHGFPSHHWNSSRSPSRPTLQTDSSPFR